MPAPDATGVTRWRACGEQLWPLAQSRIEDRLAVQATGPEYVDARELVSMRGAQVAVKAVARIRADLAACTTPRRGAVWTVHDAYTGYDSVTFTLSYTRGLGAVGFPGHPRRQGRPDHPFVRRRPALTEPRRHPPADPARPELAPDMCVFARAGC